MTEKELRQKVVSIAESYYGCKESDGSHRKIIDGYNASKPLPVNYKVTYWDAWCATFVSFVGIQAGITDIMFKECSCGRMIDLYKKAGRWIENDAYVPSPGDIIMYDWNDNGVGDNTGFPEHVGLVVSVSGNNIKIIEGNMSNAVGYRNIAVNARYIRGYCVPDYKSKASKVTTSSTQNQPTSTKPSVSTKPQTAQSASKKVDYAASYLKSISGKYKTTANLNMRTGAGTSKSVIVVIPKGETVSCYGYYTELNGVKWYYVSYKKYEGFVSSKYIKK